MAPQIALLVHGGREFGTSAVAPLDPPVLRMQLFHHSVARPLARVGVESRRFRFTQRGWNGDGALAVADLRGAIDDLAERAGATLVLVGHSMGGRASMRVVDHPAVIGVIGLAPWLPADEPMVDVARRSLRVAHGTHDRTTRPRLSAEFVERARAAGSDARHVMVPGEGHALLRRPRWWNRFIVESVTELFSVAGS